MASKKIMLTRPLTMMRVSKCRVFCCLLFWPGSTSSGEGRDVAGRYGLGYRQIDFPSRVGNLPLDSNVCEQFYV